MELYMYTSIKVFKTKYSICVIYVFKRLKKPYFDNN